MEIYNQWNTKKQALHNSDRTEVIYFKEGDIWWVSLGYNIGSESYGKGEDFKRPVLIVKKLSTDLCIVVPITTKPKSGSWFVEISVHKEARWCMLQHTRSLHKKRFWTKLCELDSLEVKKVKEKLKLLLESS